MQDFAFARKYVVLNVQPVHGGDVRFDDGVRNQMPQFGEFALAGFDGVQRFGSPCKRLRMVFVVGSKYRA